MGRLKAQAQAQARREYDAARRERDLTLENEGLRKSLRAVESQLVPVVEVRHAAPSWAVRQQCLELAIKHIASGYDGNQVTALAQQFYDFVRGSDKPGVSKDTTKPPNVAPVIAQAPG